ncbi:MAG: hypothetical protein QGH33_02445, partial [Pirellulaceae bacterium]|nr:hypothetical protein [Pirellulaceae bacterium]
MTRIRWYGPTLVLLITALLVMLVAPQLVQRLEWYRTGAQITLARDTNLENLSLTDLSNAFRNVAKAVRPSVVHIQVEGRLTRRSRLSRELEERLRRRFFQDPQEWPKQKQYDKEDRGLHQYDIPHPIGNGSGWVYDDQGHIITNYHVV